MKIRFTYAVVTHESAENGDTADNGWYIPGMGKFPVSDDTAAEWMECSAKDAVRQIQHTVGDIDSVSVFTGQATFYPSDSDEDFDTGDRTSYHAHVECDPRLLEAILRALGCKSDAAALKRARLLGR